MRPLAFITGDSVMSVNPNKNKMNTNGMCDTSLTFSLLLSKPVNKTTLA